MVLRSISINYKDMDNKFWEVKSMVDFTADEWDAICLKCGKCCVLKSFDSGMIGFSNRVCDGMDMKTARCTRYAKRICSDCAKVDLNLLRDQPELLPETCAYRLLYEGKGLPNYHPLITGDENSVRKAKQSVLDWPGIHSCRQLREDIFYLHRKAADKKWTEAKIEKEERKIQRRYKIDIVIHYPIPQKEATIGNLLIEKKPETD